ncbi:MAG TPA: hypothetical protein VNS88_18080 [Nitrospiraceae bacterium]|nr:hypothetical protein [Nitrospiraceae bacterium]
MTRLRERPTGDLMVLMVALTVCGSVVFGGMAIIVVTLVRPDVDVSNAARNIADLLNTLIGLLAGFLAGRTDANVTAARKIQEDMERKQEP